MDALDVRIIRTMGFRPYERRPRSPEVLHPSYIAKRVGVTPETVKARIASMEKAGVIAGYKLVPNLRHLGLAAEAYYFSFRDDARKDGPIGRIAALKGLLEIHDFLGRGLCVDFAFEDPATLQANLDELNRHTGMDVALKFYVREMPRVDRDLTHLDWRILGALRSDAKRSLYDVAEDLGLSGRTVKRRYDRMAEEGSFFLMPRIDPSRAEGLFLFEILFYLDPKPAKSCIGAILKAYDGSHVYSYVPSSLELGNFDVLLFAKTTAEVEDLRRRGAEIPGVARAEAWFFRGLQDHSRWLDKAIQGRVEATGR